MTMEKVHIQLDEEGEKLLRRLAEEKYGKTKGSLSKIATDAIKLLYSKTKS